ncbi:MAG TPA: hypothetical protein VGQ38_20555 [Gaiellaceae bacterium]|nr:hypothetical protein [Gaiellaceae bacterium]
MPIVTECTHEGCSTLTIGPTCIEHEARIETPKIRRRARTQKRVLAVK